MICPHPLKPQNNENLQYQITEFIREKANSQKGPKLLYVNINSQSSQKQHELMQKSIFSAPHLNENTHKKTSRRIFCWPRENFGYQGKGTK